MTRGERHLPATHDIGGPPRAFISYTHDSEAHAQDVLRLANRLREEGVDCDLDQYHMAPKEGWTRWMEGSIRAADFVLVVCTETYNLRVSGQEQHGVGLGAKWEGAIIGQAVYDADGDNEKFLPVLFSSADIEHRPTFLRATTYYDLSTEGGYEALYRRLTSQPSIVAPELGIVRDLGRPDPARRATGPDGEDERVADLVLLFSERSELVLYHCVDVRLADNLELTLEPISAADTSLLNDLRSRRARLTAVAYGTSAFLGDVTTVQQTVRHGLERWELVVGLEASDYGAGMMEMSTSGVSADQFAAMRARRILLDERMDETPFARRPERERQFLDLLIRGQSTPLQVPHSPFPDLFRQIGADPGFFVAAARLVAVLWLRLSGVVEYVDKLNLRLVGATLSIDFAGRRHRKYSNVEPTTISVVGECDLGRAI